MISDELIIKMLDAQFKIHWSNWKEMTDELEKKEFISNMRAALDALVAAVKNGEVTL